MKDLVPLKVKIGQRPNGHADHPDFNLLASVAASGIDWSRYVDLYGDGWHYDKQCGHKEEDATSPRGMQWGVLLVPAQFASEALDAFPSLCSVLSEAEFSDFYDNRAHAHEPDEHIDAAIVEGINAKKGAGKALTQQQVDALDPDKPTPGIRKNKLRLWADAKAHKGINLVAP